MTPRLRQNFPAHSSRFGFTLIELLTVIGIIAVLAGLLFPVITMARQSAYRAATNATMGSIEAAIARFRMVNDGALPLDPVVAIEDPEAPHDPNIPNNNGIVETWESNSSDGRKHLEEFAADLATVDGDSFGTHGRFIVNGLIVDGWAQPFRYRPFIAYPSGPYFEVNPDSYQLWSIGADGSCQVSSNNNPQQTGDDIVNWGRR